MPMLWLDLKECRKELRRILHCPAQDVSLCPVDGFDKK